MVPKINMRHSNAVNGKAKERCNAPNSFQNFLPESAHWRLPLSAHTSQSGQKPTIQSINALLKSQRKWFILFSFQSRRFKVCWESELAANETSSLVWSGFWKRRSESRSEKLHIPERQKYHVNSAEAAFPKLFINMPAINLVPWVQLHELLRHSLRPPLNSWKLMENECSSSILLYLLLPHLHHFLGKQHSKNEFFSSSPSIRFRVMSRKKSNRILMTTVGVHCLKFDFTSPRFA